jgi:amino acid transporter
LLGDTILIKKKETMFWKIKRLFIGHPLATEHLQHQKLSNTMALAVFSSDAISSVAYATEEILLVFMLAGTAALTVSIPVAMAISTLFFIVVVSYRQTISAYPSGGGSYIVAKDNLGVFPGLLAAASLLTDYIMTVAVSTASGIAAVTSAFPALYSHKVTLCVLCVALITLANLRGAKESGTIFSIPTYFFVVTLGISLLVGLYREFFSPEALQIMDLPELKIIEPLSFLLILRAFASGCAALTGIEAISNGIPAFRPPETKNAQKVLGLMAALCLFLFMGTTYLAHSFHVVPTETETVVSQMARTIFGRNFFYYALQAGTALILLMGANTSFADFPRLASIMSRAGYMPRQMANLGDRLVFANGILILGAISAFLLFLFGGNVHRLIPLYAVGVFLSFTLSQSGMVVHWWRLRTPGWKYSIALNALGAVITALVTVVVVATKFLHGAWVMLILIPLLTTVFYRIHSHYRNVADNLLIPPGPLDLTPLKNHVYLPISGITSISLYALRFCLSISKDLTGIYVNVNQDTTEHIREQIAKMNLPIPFLILDSPYRSVTGPLIEYLDRQSREHPEDLFTLVIPEFMPFRKWQYFMHNQTAVLLYAALRGRENIVITSVRKRLKQPNRISVSDTNDQR